MLLFSQFWLVFFFVYIAKGDNKTIQISNANVTTKSTVNKTTTISSTTISTTSKPTPKAETPTTPAPKIIPDYECAVDINTTHKIDLLPLKNSQVSHFAVSRSGIYVMKICSPVNLSNFYTGNQSTLKECDPRMGICFISLNLTKVIGMGQPNKPPTKNEKGQIILEYEDGDVCETDRTRNYTSEIILTCDRDGDIGDPAIISDDDECKQVIHWPTVIVCEPDTIHNHDCVYQDDFTDMSVDLTEIFSTRNHVTKGKQEFHLQLCNNNHPSINITECNNSAVCLEDKISNNQTKWLSLANAANSAYWFHGNSLHLTYYNGSQCNGTSKWSTEITISCPKDKWIEDSAFKLDSMNNCKASLSLSHREICQLVPPTCTLRVPNPNLSPEQRPLHTLFFDLRELTSITHAWSCNNTATNETFYFNVCHSIPKSYIFQHSSAARCVGSECINIGLPGTMSMSYEKTDYTGKKYAIAVRYHSMGKLLCKNNKAKVQTKILFICDKLKGEPKFLTKIDNETHCEYIFKWKTFSACPVTDDSHLEKYAPFVYFDNRTDIQASFAVDLRNLTNQEFETVGDKYTFYFNFIKDMKTRPPTKCANAAICQVETNGSFSRDIGSFGTESLTLEGNELRMKYISTNDQRCGKSKDKNVTSHITFRCNPDANMNKTKPVFFYESNNCDYFFTWETDLICKQKMLSIEEYKSNEASSASHLTPPEKHQNTSSSSKLFKFLAVLLLLVCGLLIFVHLRYRNDDR